MFLALPVFKVNQSKHATPPAIVLSIFIAAFLPPALVDIILILAPGTAES